MKQNVGDFVREITFKPGFDHVVLGPKEKEKYGRHGMTLHFSLAGEKGAVAFQMFTDWLPQIQDKSGMWEPTFTSPTMASLFPQAAGLYVHSPVPLYEGHEGQDDCRFTKKGELCYSSGHILYSENLMALLINEGEEALWKQLEKDYFKHLGKGGDDNG